MFFVLWSLPFSMENELPEALNDLLSLRTTSFFLSPIFLLRTESNVPHSTNSPFRLSEHVELSDD